MKAIVNVPICTLYAQPTRESTTEDEALYGMVVEILEEVQPGWYRIRTHYRYEGMVSGEDLLLDPAAISRWEAQPKKVIWYKNHCDVLSEPRVQGWHKLALHRGCILALVGEPENGWQQVALADGRTGYVQSSILGTYHTEPLSQDEQTLRKALVDTVMLYERTHYRWGGKTPAGIDCSGLCSMTYLMCGIAIFRDASVREGFPMHKIDPKDRKPGDLLFFPGHVAMYLGNERYCHSTGKAGCDGFVINSLDPNAPDFRQDLLETMTYVASYFG